MKVLTPEQQKQYQVWYAKGLVSPEDIVVWLWRNGWSVDMAKAITNKIIGYEPIRNSKTTNGLTV